MAPIGRIASAALLLIALSGCGSQAPAQPVAGPGTATVTTAAPTTIEPTGVPAAGATPLVADLADAAYATVSDAERLDLYEPATGDAPHPLVVIIHGGGWVTGDKRSDLPMAAIPGFLDRGYAVASINYRLTSEAIFPAQLLDAKAAIRFLRANAGDFDLDPDRIAVVGESAGAHLALLLGTTADVARFDDPALGNGGVSSAVQAVVDFYGPADLATADIHRTLNPSCPSEPDPNIASLLGAPPAAAGDLAAAASPVSYLHPFQTLPPFFIAHGDADCIVPYQQSVELHEAIEAVAPGRSTLAIVPGSGHYLSFDFDSQSSALIEFLAGSIGPSPERS